LFTSDNPVIYIVPEIISLYALLFLSLSNYQVAKIFKKYGYLIFIPSKKKLTFLSAERI